MSQVRQCTDAPGNDRRFGIHRKISNNSRRSVTLTNQALLNFLALALAQPRSGAGLCLEGSMAVLSGQQAGWGDVELPCVVRYRRNAFVAPLIICGLLLL